MASMVQPTPRITQAAIADRAIMTKPETKKHFCLDPMGRHQVVREKTRKNTKQENTMISPMIKRQIESFSVSNTVSGIDMM